MAQSRPVVAGLAGLILGCASVLSFVWSTDRQILASYAIAGLNAEPRLAMEAATARFAESGGSLDGIDLPQLRAGLTLAPLEEEPFVYSAAELMRQGRIAEAEHLLEIAVRRNPRSSVARVLLLDQLARRGNASASVAQIEALSRLVPAQREALQNTLAYLASMPATREATLDSISDRSLKAIVLRRLAQGGASASMMLDAIDKVGDLELGDERASFVASIVNPLIAAGDWDGALRLWLNFNQDAFADGSLVLDPTFAGTYGPPFGWTLSAGNGGYARMTNAGLAGEFYGRRQTVLAQQTVILAPGSYRVRIAAEDPGRGLQLAVKCKDGTELAMIVMESGHTAEVFHVPDTCAALDLQLRGRPSDPPATTSFRIREIDLERVTS